MSTAMKYDRNNEELRMDTAVLAADTFEAQIAGTQPVIPVQGILAGPDTFDWEAVKQRMEGDPRRGDDNLHFAMNVDTLLRMGFSGIAEAAEEKSRSCQGKPAVFLQAIARCHRAAASFAEARMFEPQLRDVSQVGFRGEPNVEGRFTRRHLKTGPCASHEYIITQGHRGFCQYRIVPRLLNPVCAA